MLRAMPQYAGPLRIPPEQFQLRVREEPATKDAVNSRSIEDWAAAVPQQQTDYVRIDREGLGIFVGQKKPRSAAELRVAAQDLITRVQRWDAEQAERRRLGYPDMETTRPVAQPELVPYILELDTTLNIRTAPFGSAVSEALQTTFMDMAPLSSRTDKRDFRQSRPYDPTGPGLALNPFFDRYDPVTDPRNTIRELRSAVYELKDAERGSEESARIRTRGFANRSIPEGETPTAITEVYELLRPKIDNPAIVYRNHQDIQSLGSPLS